MNRSRMRALTLVELMVVVTVISVLLAIAYGSYTQSIRKANRGDAQSALTGLAAALQRYYTEQSPSTYVGSAASGPPGAPKSSMFDSQAPLEGADKHYNLTIQSASATAYEIRATPISGSFQDGDKCGTLTLTSTGQRGVTGAAEGTTWQDCWK